MLYVLKQNIFLLINRMFGKRVFSFFFCLISWQSEVGSFHI